MEPPRCCRGASASDMEPRRNHLKGGSASGTAAARRLCRTLTPCGSGTHPGSAAGCPDSGGASRRAAGHLGTAQSLDPSAGFTLVETLLALVLALAAVGLLGGLGPLADLAGALGQQRVAQRAAANLSASWPSGRAPADRRVSASDWAGLASDDPRVWFADAAGWGAWADAADGGAPSAAPLEDGSTAPRFELVLVDGTDERTPGATGDGAAARPGSAVPAWIVVSWPVYEGRSVWVERARRHRWSLAVNLNSR